jgi:hypothetical protein
LMLRRDHTLCNGWGHGMLWPQPCKSMAPSLSHRHLPSCLSLPPEAPGHQP